MSVWEFIDIFQDTVDHEPARIPASDIEAPDEEWLLPTYRKPLRPQTTLNEIVVNDNATELLRTGVLQTHTRYVTVTR